MKIEFTKHSSHNDRRDTVVAVSLPKLMEAWQGSDQAQVSRNENDHPGGGHEKAVAKRGFYADKLDNGKPIEMARVNLGIIFDDDFNRVADDTDPKTLQIGDGRHRLTEMLEKGVKTVEVSIPEYQQEGFLALYGAETAAP